MVRGWETKKLRRCEIQRLSNENNGHNGRNGINENDDINESNDQKIFRT